MIKKAFGVGVGVGVSRLSYIASQTHLTQHGLWTNFQELRGKQIVNGIPAP
jgi:hypothetical protein